MNFATLAVEFLLVLVLSILFHELMHVLTLWACNKRKPQLFFTGGRIRVGTAADYMNLSRKQAASVYLNGFAAGIFVILLISFITGKAYYAVLFVPYLLASFPDLRNLSELAKNK